MYERTGREGTFSQTRVNVCFDPLLGDTLPKHFPAHSVVFFPLIDLQCDRHVRGRFIPGYLYWVMMYSLWFLFCVCVFSFL